MINVSYKVTANKFDWSKRNKILETEQIVGTQMRTFAEKFKSD